jgi:23S rRNA (cytidine1920-2'-O)/16S rRNA (cytidine1409-2'-O)-methyltransferase
MATKAHNTRSSTRTRVSNTARIRPFSYNTRGRMTMPAKTRLDRLLVDRELVESRTRAAALIIAGKVEVEGRRVDKPGTSVPIDARIEVRGPDHPFASRGGIKLQAALDAFELDVTRRVAMDVGASTGGFTDCLLQRGAARVHAVDVGYGQLAW